MMKSDREAPGHGRRRGHARVLLPVCGALVVLGAMAWAGVSRADGWHDRGPGLIGGGRGMMGMMMFDQLDADNDGRVSRAEMEAFRAERLQRADRNGDGRLDQQEFETFWLELTRPMRIRAFQFLDADGDSVVTAAELQRPSDRLFSRLDRDGDGFLAPMTTADRERMRERMRERDRRRD